MSQCRAYQVSDQMLCPCGRQWDVGDPEPPQCQIGRGHQRVGVGRRAWLAIIERLYQLKGKRG